MRLSPAWRDRALCVWGPQDQLFKGVGDAWQGAADALQVGRLLFVQGAGHWVQYEAADVVNAALVDSFDGLCSDIQSRASMRE